MKAVFTLKRQPWWRRFVAIAALAVLVSRLFGFSEDLTLPPDLDTSTDQGGCGNFPAATVFRPKVFMENGAGKEYLGLYHNQSRGSLRRRLLNVRFVLYNLASQHCRPIYYHIHKNGGSTMNVRSTDLLPGIGKLQSYYTSRENQLGHERFENETMTILREARRASKTMPIFTFLRDPVARFLSGVGQALKLNRLGPCTKNRSQKDSLDLLDCILTEIQVKKLYLDEHLEPQIFELYHGMMGFDLQVHVMDLKTMDIVLEQVLGLQAQDKSRRQTRGLVAGYNLSLSLLTPMLVERICSVYRIDVLLVHETKVTFTACSMIFQSLERSNF